VGFRRGKAFWISALLVLTASSVATLSGSSPVQAAPVTIQILGTNDFHGRLTLSAPNGGAAVLSGAVKQLEINYPTVFAAAGDLIGATTFESFIQKDKPTIDALNAAGLDVSAVGNHEFDQGYTDLTTRVMAPFDATTNPYGGALWKYLGANVRNADTTPALPESWVTNVGGVDVGFVGAVTEHLPELVSPAGLTGLVIESPVVAANRTAAALKAGGADIVILLVHEGASTTAYADAVDPASDFGKIVNGASPDIDAIVSGHTHLAYNHQVPVAAWASRPVQARPVVSAGQYGFALDQLLFTVDPDTGVVSSVTSAILPLLTSTAPVTPNYPADAPTAAIVTAAVNSAAALGAVVLGQVGGPFNRAQIAAGTENRGGESTLGNLVAEVQQTATEAPAQGGADIALMNPGGLRANLTGNVVAPPVYPADVTYKQAADVQPFANTLVNMTLTGSQLKTALEQQWQPAGAQRPFLRLGLSDGFTYTYDPTAASGAHVTSMQLDGVTIDPAGAYSVTVNSFLASGGDNFTVLASGTNRRDTGRIDLQSMVDYMDNFSPVAVDYSQRSVGIDLPVGAPSSYLPGDTVQFAVTSLDMATAALPAGGLRDATIDVSLNGTSVGSFPVDHTVGAAVDDETGRAAVSFVVPAGTRSGVGTLTITGATTGTVVSSPLTIGAVFTSIAPVRVLDTRTNLVPTSGGARTSGSSANLVATGSTVTIPVTALAAFPAGATSAVVNVTATRVDEAGFLTVYACDTPRPDTSNANFGPGADTANVTITALAADGTICVYTSGATDLVVDAIAYTTGGFTPTLPARLADTRSGTRPVADGVVRVPLPAGSTHVVNVTSTQSDADGVLSVYDCDSAPPTTSNVNFTAGGDVANVAVVAADGELCVSTSAPTHVIVDHLGTLVGSTGRASRLVDTRTTTSAKSGTVITIPTIATPDSTAVINVTATRTTAAGYVTIAECGAPVSNTSSLNVTPGRDIANVAIIPTTKSMCVSVFADTDIIVDLQSTLT
jgi:5'-nucleotidase